MRSICEGRSIYRLFDPYPPKFGCQLIPSWKEVPQWNDKHFGIFWTVNQFNGARKKENCTKVLSWIIDIDDGTKEEQRERIKAINILPSSVIETKRGFHVYFNCKDGDPANYVNIEERLIEKYGGDKNAKDICRILRAPLNYHWKDENNPFIIREVQFSDAEYTEIEMRNFFPVIEEKEIELTETTYLRKELTFQKDTGLWERVWNMNCEDALSRLSGTSIVGGEKYTFKRSTNGKKNILVNGKSSSCWIDANGRIGSTSGGGPTPYQWIKWFGKSNKEAYEDIKQIFPEVLK